MRPVRVVAGDVWVCGCVCGGGNGEGGGEGDGYQVLLISLHELAGPSVPHVYFAWNAVAPENIEP
ncbi:unnamed protein product [Bathycoccus prasinos]